MPGGGEGLDATLAELLKVDRPTAEALKIALGSAVTPERPASVPVGDVTVTSDQLLGPIQDWLHSTIEAVRRPRDQTRHRLDAGLLERGFTLTGGGALLAGVERYLSSQTGIPFRVADDPRTCAVRGAGRALREFEVVHRRQLFVGGR